MEILTRLVHEFLFGYNHPAIEIWTVTQEVL
jgi:hypothetical protein